LTSPAIEFASESLQLSKSGRLYDSKYDAKAIQRGISEPRRWTTASKKEFYDNYAEDLASRKSHDETFAVGVNKKFWTHLLNGGISAGGHLEKLDTAPKRSTGHHLKSGLYKGKFSNVQHKQMIFRDRRKTGGASYTEDRLLKDDEVHQAIIDFSKKRPAGRQPLIRTSPGVYMHGNKKLVIMLHNDRLVVRSGAGYVGLSETLLTSLGTGSTSSMVESPTSQDQDRQVDTRDAFDTRVKDDMINTNDATNKYMAAAAYDLQRPVHTRSCPQMGAEWMHR
jgi:hypothetical protein